jgi:hypothetical protein
MFATRVATWANPNPTPSTFSNSAYWSTSADQNYFLSMTSSTDLINWMNLSTGFTIEYWFYQAGGFTNEETAGPGNHAYNSTNYWSFGPGGAANQRVSLAYELLSGGRNNIRTTSGTITSNTWYNIAMVSTPNPLDPLQSIITFYINGVRTQITTGSGGPFTDTITIDNALKGAITTSQPFSMGSITDATVFPKYWNNFYMDNLRVSNIARYSGASYTVATTPFTSDAYTQLLMWTNGVNGSTTFTDSSSYNRTITNNSNNVVTSNAHANHT